MSNTLYHLTVRSSSFVGRCLVFILLGCTLQPSSLADEAEQRQMFESEIRPILVEHCFDCHSGEEVEADLSLESKAGWEQGGQSGPAIIPGDLDKSLLIDAVRYTEKVVPGMPPDSKLSDGEISKLEQWVQAGAYDPRESDGAPKKREAFDLGSRRESHWSWASIRPHDPPEVQNNHWPLGDVDRFVLAQIESAGLKPAADADRLTWLRRVTFDLIGLPPTPAEINAFENDASSDAHEKVVERLLQSPHFGEKWARHWLDLVRYAETYGHEFDYAIDHAHEYRDYVIRALNADLPYDQFVREHIAGDLLDPPRRHPSEGFNESIIATGFWHLHESTHAPTDVLQNEADIVSNQIDVFGKTFLGLTVACARCHDHKFDAISTADYYALSAYLKSSNLQNFPLDPQGKIHANVESIRALRNELTRAILADPMWKSPGFRSQAEQHVQSVEAGGVTEARHAAWNEFKQQSHLFVDFLGGKLPPGWRSTGLAFVPITDAPQFLVTATDKPLVPGTVDGGAYGERAAGTLRSPSFEVSHRQIHIRMRSDAGMFVRLVIENYQMAPRSDLLFRGSVLRDGATDTGGKFVWKTMAGDLNKYIGRRAFLEFVDKGDGSLAVDQVWFSDRAPPPDSVMQRNVPQPIDWDRLTESGKQRRVNPSLRWILENRELVQRHASDAVKTLWQRFTQACDATPPPRYVVAMEENTREEAPIYIRGRYTNLGAGVPPRNLTALGGGEGDRRLLAAETASIANPLTARVIVNRIWHHLFGRGIVASVDDFGPQGVLPTHPELLDTLAFRFAEDGWSIKGLIERLVLSRTYRQSSNAAPDLSTDRIDQADPTNQLLHRMSVRRLPAESIRDSILAISGRLDPTLFGPSVATYRTPFMTGRGARPSGPLDGQGRRTIYLSVYRNFLNPFLLTFDMPNPFGPKGRRSVSNVPAQSLAMMNDPFVVEQAKRWAGRLTAQYDDPRERLRSMVLVAHGVHASESDLDRLQNFVNELRQSGGAEQDVWQDTCHAIWNMKAFLYLR